MTDECELPEGFFDHEQRNIEDLEEIEPEINDPPIEERADEPRVLDPEPQPNDQWRDIAEEQIERQRRDISEFLSKETDYDLERLYKELKMQVDVLIIFCRELDWSSNRQIELTRRLLTKCGGMIPAIASSPPQSDDESIIEPEIDQGMRPIFRRCLEYAMKSIKRRQLAAEILEMIEGFERYAQASPHFRARRLYRRISCLSKTFVERMEENEVNPMNRAYLENTLRNGLKLVLKILRGTEIYKDEDEENTFNQMLDQANPDLLIYKKNFLRWIDYQAIARNDPLYLDLEKIDRFLRFYQKKKLDPIEQLDEVKLNELLQETIRQKDGIITELKKFDTNNELTERIDSKLIMFWSNFLQKFANNFYYVTNEKFYMKMREILKLTISEEVNKQYLCLLRKQSKPSSCTIL